MIHGSAGMTSQVHHDVTYYDVMPTADNSQFQCSSAGVESVKGNLMGEKTTLYHKYIDIFTTVLSLSIGDEVPSDEINFTWLDKVFCKFGYFDILFILQKVETASSVSNPKIR